MFWRQKFIVAPELVRDASHVVRCEGRTKNVCSGGEIDFLTRNKEEEEEEEESCFAVLFPWIVGRQKAAGSIILARFISQ